MKGHFQVHRVVSHFFYLTSNYICIGKKNFLGKHFHWKSNKANNLLGQWKAHHKENEQFNIKCTILSIFVFNNLTKSNSMLHRTVPNAL